MVVTSGFFNSIDHDRKYDAEQMGSLFDGIIEDGVYVSIGTGFTVKENAGMTVEVGVGRGWFMSSWIYNDAPALYTITPADLVYSRIDMLAIDVDHTEAIRANTIKYIKGVAAPTPVEPTLIDTLDHKQYPLCAITVDPGTSQINNNKIRNLVGTTRCPFVTGPLKALSVEDLINQWETQLTDDVAFNLLALINNLNRDKAPINSPIFTGVPEVPDAASTSNNNQAANTEWVNNKIAEVTMNPGRMLRYVFTQSGQLRIPANAKYAFALGVGGGGSGGSAQAYTSSQSERGDGGGGGSGRVAILHGIPNKGSTASITIGAGGKGRTTDGVAGNNGGATTIANLIPGQAQFVVNGGDGGGAGSSTKGGDGGNGGSGGGGGTPCGKGGNGDQFGGGGGAHGSSSTSSITTPSGNGGSGRFGGGGGGGGYSRYSSGRGVGGTAVYGGSGGNGGNTLTGNAAAGSNTPATNNIPMFNDDMVLYELFISAFTSIDASVTGSGTIDTVGFGKPFMPPYQGLGGRGEIYVAGRNYDGSGGGGGGGLLGGNGGESPGASSTSSAAYGNGAGGGGIGGNGGAGGGGAIYGGGGGGGLLVDAFKTGGGGAFYYHGYHYDWRQNQTSGALTEDHQLGNAAHIGYGEGGVGGRSAQATNSDNYRLQPTYGTSGQSGLALIIVCV